MDQALESALSQNLIGHIILHGVSPLNLYHHWTNKTAPFTDDDDDDNTPISTNQDGNITLMSC